MIAPIPATDTTRGGGTEPPGLGSSGICVSYLTPVRVTHLTRERARTGRSHDPCTPTHVGVYLEPQMEKTMKILIALFPFLFGSTAHEPLVTPLESEMEAVLVPDGYQGPVIAIPADVPVF
jgi:hypothetical protein